MEERIFRLYGSVQHYAWGGYDYIPSLLGVEKNGKPFAEYWMGAHAHAACFILINGSKQLLSEAIKNDPDKFLGPGIKKEFGELPFLFKVLDVNEMLSIQVHPEKAAAIEGFTKEQQAGIPIDSPARNYRDANHKPEVSVALTEFWLLHGFKKEEELRKVLTSVPEFNNLLSTFENKGYRGLYEEVMLMPQEDVNRILSPLVAREKSQQSLKYSPGYWVNKLNPKEGHYDRGIFSIYFFNLVKLNPGEAIFQANGIAHAYLEGKCVELMSNSDNVLRGGLTPKHIDVNELMKHIMFKGIEPKIIKGKKANAYEQNYPVPVRDFAISSIELDTRAEYKHESMSPEIYLVMEGSVKIGEEKFSRGDAFYVLPSANFSVVAASPAKMFKAFV